VPNAESKGFLKRINVNSLRRFALGGGLESAVWLGDEGGVCGCGCVWGARNDRGIFGVFKGCLKGFMVTHFKIP